VVVLPQIEFPFVVHLRQTTENLKFILGAFHVCNQWRCCQIDCFSSRRRMKLAFTPNSAFPHHLISPAMVVLFKN